MGDETDTSGEMWTSEKDEEYEEDEERPVFVDPEDAPEDAGFSKTAFLTTMLVSTLVVTALLGGFIMGTWKSSMPATLEPEFEARAGPEGGERRAFDTTLSEDEHGNNNGAVHGRNNITVRNVVKDDDEYQHAKEATRMNAEEEGEGEEDEEEEEEDKRDTTRTKTSSRTTQARKLGSGRSTNRSVTRRAARRARTRKLPSRIIRKP